MSKWTFNVYMILMSKMDYFETVLPSKAESSQSKKDGVIKFRIVISIEIHLKISCIFLSQASTQIDQNFKNSFTLGGLDPEINIEEKNNDYVDNYKGKFGEKHMTNNLYIQ